MAVLFTTVFTTCGSSCVNAQHKLMRVVVIALYQSWRNHSVSQPCFSGLKDWVWLRFHTEVTKKLIYYGGCVYSFVCFANPPHLSLSALAVYGLFWIASYHRTCPRSRCGYLRVNKLDTLPHQRLGVHSIHMTEVCPVPFMLHLPSCCSPSQPLLLEPLQGQRSTASVGLLWLCQSQQGGHSMSTGSTIRSHSHDYDFFCTYAAYDQGRACTFWNVWQKLLCLWIDVQPL